MSDATGPLRKHGPPQVQSSGSGRTMMTAWRQQPYIHEPISSKRVCFYKSGDSQFSGLPVVINNRTFKTFESLLDSLSRRVPLPFGVRTITTPRGHTTVRSLEQLHHGHNYICSDQRTVKPVDLERARRRPPPWYHARPASGPRRRALTQQREEIRSRRRRRRREATPHLLSTPRRLVVFRNGRPEEKHTVLLQKRSARSFEALLDYVSEVMHFHVVKLYMPDGHRVDGLPGLILCSGVLVAAGREPFKVGDYDTQRPIAPTWLPAKRVGSKWVHPSRRKKKSGSNSVRSRIFSPSSERFFVNQIRNSVAGSVGDAAGSLEMETSNALGSLAGTDILTYGEGTSDTQALPDDDIEKSFRINQDGSMTVEMKVRLTIKEEERVHWTTTLSRSTVPTQMMEASIVSGDVDTGLTDFTHFPPPPDPDNDPDIAAIEATCGESQDLVPPVKSSLSETSEPVREKEEEQTGNAQVLSPLACRMPTPGPRKVRQMQSSVEKVLEGSETEIQKDMVGSYSYREEKQEYCIVQQASNKPVPKPRNANLSETNKIVHSSTSVQSQYKSAEVLKVQDSGEEIRETVLHIYEQQTCQDNFVANTQFRVREVATYSRPTSADTVLPASSEKTPHSSSLDWEGEQNPSTASKSNSEGKQVDKLSFSNLNNPPCQTLAGTDNCSNAISGDKMSNSNQHSTENSADPQSLTKKKKPVTFMLNKNSQIFQSTASEKKRKENVAEILRGIRKRKNSPGTPTGPVKTAERLKAKSAQKLLKKRHKMQPAEHDVSVSDMSSQQPAEILTQVKEHKNELSKLNEPVTGNKRAEKSDALNVQQKRNVLEVEGVGGKASLIRQTSMHEEKQSTRETAELSESVSLPALNSSSSMINEYVEQWLLTSRHDAISDMDEEPPCNVQPISQSASQQGDDPKALFQISSDGEGSPWVDNEKTNVAEDPSKDALSTSMPCLEQSSQISQDSNKIAEPSQPASELVQSQENASRKSNALETVALHTDFSLMKSSPSVNPTVENNAVSTNSTVAKEIQPCVVSEEKLLSLDSQNLKDLPPPLPLPRGNNLEKKQSTSHPSPKKSSPTRDVKKVPVLGISNFERTRSRYESQRKTGNSNQTTDKKHQPSVQASSNSSNSPKPSPKSTLKENAQIVNTPTTERNVASCDSNMKTNRQALKNITFPPPPQETHRNTQMSTVVPAPTGSYTVRMAARPDMKPVVEQVCLSIQSINVTSQQTRPSCLEKSNSLPDFSSHIASTFGSSSRVLLAFLSVMALKDGLSNLNSNKQLGIDNLIYSEALRLLNSLKELARIEDAQVLSESLSALQNSISRRLLQSWRGFQELTEQARSRSVTPSSSSSESDGPAGVEPEEEKVIEELMGELGVPERVREELAALHSEGETSVCKQGRMKDTPLLQLKEETVMKDQASQFQNEKMKFNEKVTGASNQVQRSEKQKMTVKITGDNYPKKNTITVQQSVEYFKEDRDSKESIESHHEVRALESLSEIPLNGFTESHPTEDTVSLSRSLLSAQMQSVRMPYNDPQFSVVLSSSNLMPKVSSDERNLSGDEGQLDPKCQFTYLDKKADHLAQSKAESDIHVGRQLSNDEEKPSPEKDNDGTESKGVDVTDPEDGEEDVTPTEEEDRGVELQSGAEEKPSCSDKSCQEDEEDEEDICEELMGFSEEPGEENDKPSDTEMQQTTPAGVEYIAKSKVTSHEHSEEMDKIEANGEQGRLSQTKEPHIFEMKHAGKEEHREMESTAVTKNGEDNDNGPSHKERSPSPMEQHIILDNPECYSSYQDNYLAEPQCTTGEMKSHETTSLLHPKERAHLVGGIVSNLEEQPRHVEQKAERSKNEHSRSHIEVPEVSENDDFTSVSHLSDEQAKIEEFMTVIPGVKQSPSIKETRETVLSNAYPQLINTTRSSPVSRVTSPLAFSYDSRSRDSEGSPQPNKVKSIREMFLAKSTSDNQCVTRRQPSPLRSDQSDSYPGTSDSGATGSQNSPDNSSAEEDTGRLAIAKGYVRKTIERLYGKGGTVKTHEANRPTSASKGKRKEAIMQNSVRSLTALHEARSQVKSDLSYFNATSSIDIINEPTQCISMNAQVNSPNAVLIDEGRWLLRNNHPLETTPSEVLGTVTNQKSPASDFELRSAKGDRKEDTPYSHFSSVASVKVDMEEPVATHCTYLTLPHGGDSDPDEDEGREGPWPEADVSKKRKEVQKMGPITEAPKASLERNGVLPGFIPEFKRGDNKVHPLMSILPLAPPVVTQPSKRQASQTTQTAVIRSPNTTAEPDFLETLYVTCGEHCPFL